MISAVKAMDPRRRGWLIHAAAFAVANPLIFALQRRRGTLSSRGALVQLGSWGGGLAFHYVRAVMPLKRQAAAGAGGER